MTNQYFHFGGANSGCLEYNSDRLLSRRLVSVVTMEGKTTTDSTYVQLKVDYYTDYYTRVTSLLYIKTTDGLTSLFKEVEAIIVLYNHYRFEVLNTLSEAQYSAVSVTFKALGSVLNVDDNMHTTVDGRNADIDIDGIRNIIKKYKEETIDIKEFVRYISSYAWISDIGEPTERTEFVDNE